ncbi:MAG TPA: HEAT repeat domain-containing protein [Xanthobacteraceae bacterium]|nr:HEAT repeat domain-containing protein [Xanthobacteraceae bacterium]
MTPQHRVTTTHVLRRLRSSGINAAIVAIWAATGGTALAQTKNLPERAIVEFSFADLKKSYHLLNQAGFEQRAALRNAALTRLNDTDARVRYAAIYALAITADAKAGANALAGVLGSGSTDERLLAAGALAGIGDKRGFPALIDALDDRTQLEYRLPPTLALHFAKSQLLWFTTQDFGLKSATSDEQIANTKAAWQQWWQKARFSLHRDPKIRKYVE